jgi:hypothetical protein
VGDLGTLKKRSSSSPSVIGYTKSTKKNMVRFEDYGLKITKGGFEYSHPHESWGGVMGYE